MTLPCESVFTALHKWAKRQDENYCTEGLAFILGLLLREAPRQGIAVVRWLAGDLFSEVSDPSALRVRTQIRESNGQPDLEIASAEELAWVEVKVDSEVGEEQLSRYQEMLRGKSPRRTRLTLLCRNGHETPDGTEYFVRTWIELANELQQHLDALKAENARRRVEYYLADFLTFLESKQMKLQALSSDVVTSIPVVGSLMLLIRTAISTAGHKPLLGCGDDWMGYYLTRSGKRQVEFGWIGYRFDTPDELIFTTDEGEFDDVLHLEHALLFAQENGWTQAQLTEDEKPRTPHFTKWIFLSDLAKCPSSTEQLAMIRRCLVDEPVRALEFARDQVQPPEASESTSTECPPTS